MKTPPSPPIVLSIAGSDCSAGAGIQADLKTFTSFGCYGMTAVTCVVSEIPGDVGSIQAIPPQIVQDQITMLLDHFPVAAIKTGMLYSGAIIRAVVNLLRSRETLPPLVIDPVMVASSGDLLLEPEAINLYTEELFPLATIITPNLDELAILDHQLPSSVEQMIAAGERLVAKYQAAFLLKGGHLKQSKAIDTLITRVGEIQQFSTPFEKDAETHGSGCTYSAAIAANLAQGKTLSESVKAAKTFIYQSIKGRFGWGSLGALNQGILS